MSTMHLPSENKERYIPDEARFIGRFQVSRELLCEVLLMPNGVKVLGLTYDPQYDRFEVSVEGDKDSGLRMTRSGFPITSISPQYQYDNQTNKSEFVGWGL
jgi:hypothetical protein